MVDVEEDSILRILSSLGFVGIQLQKMSLIFLFMIKFN